MVIRLTHFFPDLVYTGGRRLEGPSGRTPGAQVAGTQPDQGW